MRPTILIGTSGVPGAFTEAAIRAMASHVEVPIVLPLSNPTSRTEAEPEAVLAWTDGRAIVATGSPFPPVRRDGRTHEIGQANNAFVFPGIGLGAIVAEAREMPDELFLAAAEALAARVSVDRLEVGAIYPPQAELRAVSRSVAVEVVRCARDHGVGRFLRDEDLDEAVGAQMWEPDYGPVAVEEDVLRASSALR